MELKAEFYFISVLVQYLYKVKNYDILLIVMQKVWFENHILKKYYQIKYCNGQCKE